MTATQTSYEEIRDRAKSEGWNNRKVKDALYAAGMPERRDELLAELGRSRGPAVTEPVAQPAAIPSAVAESMARHAEEQRAKAAAAQAELERLAALRLEDGDVLFCDAAPNTVTRVVNGYGRKEKFDNGGFRIGLKCGEIERVAYNTQCPDQFAGECYAVLKAVELAAEYGLKKVTIRNDRIGSFTSTTKRGYAGSKYLWVAQKIATEAGLAVTFDPCSSEENLADCVSRRND